ncbi:hypothetical protein [Rubritalea sp.]|uniref:hypothetical protein n=1 Tax=Rubritalea sp. TaxID=2109375 RepID=UPI003EF520BA
MSNSPRAIATLLVNFTSDIDLFAEAGKNVAYDYLIDDIEVTDGVLNIDFLDRSLNNPTINAIGFFQVQSYQMTSLTH